MLNKISGFLLIILLTSCASKKLTTDLTDNKSTLIQSIDGHSGELIAMSDEIWALAETAFEETKSSKILADYAEAQGFRVERGIIGIPTAFVASYGSGKPIIGILGEFDALPGVSQKAVSNKDPLHEGAAGHGCGHNLFGAGSMGAAVAIKELMEAGKLSGTIKYYGTPAEEKYFAKVFMAREGVFDELDACLDWHPSASTKADVQSLLALVDFTVEFHGQAAHASIDPWNGRSASDALELYTKGLNYYREHIKPTSRIHYHIMDGGQVVNVVPDYAQIWTRVRDTKKLSMLEMYDRAKEIARGAAVMAEVDYEIKLVSGLHDVLVNRAGGTALHKNLERLGDITYTPDEIQFAKNIQQATGKKELGLDGIIRPLEPTRELLGGPSSDVGDISWVVPQIRLGVTTAPINAPWHSWAVVACGGMSIGHKGLVYAAKALGMTMIDLFENPELINQMQAEFKERKGDTVYKAILPAGPPPIPQHILDMDKE